MVREILRFLRRGRVPKKGYELVPSFRDALLALSERDKAKLRAIGASLDEGEDD